MIFLIEFDERVANQQNTTWIPFFLTKLFILIYTNSHKIFTKSIERFVGNVNLFYQKYKTGGTNFSSVEITGKFLKTCSF